MSERSLKNLVVSCNKVRSGEALLVDHARTGHDQPADPGRLGFGSHETQRKILNPRFLRRSRKGVRISLPRTPLGVFRARVRQGVRQKTLQCLRPLG